MNIISMLRKIFDPRYTDKKVGSLNKQSIKKIEEAGKVARSHVARHRRDGLAYRIIIAAGGDRND